MVDTNILLSIGFSVISNFCRIVPVGEEVAPAKVDELRKFMVMAPPSTPSIDLHLISRYGTKYCVHEGAVQLFSSSKSYRELDNPREAFRFKGTPQFSSNEVFNLAENTIGKLTTDPSRMVSSMPTIRPAADGIPFYWISWARTNSAGKLDLSAFLEVDARSGRVTYAELEDKAFFDPAFAQQISNRVYKGDVARPSRWSLQHKSPLKRLYPAPGTNEVLRAVVSWKWLCHKLNVDPGSETELTSVNWGRTFEYTNASLSEAAPVLQIVFHNGTCFESIAGVAFSHYSMDACFTGFWQDMTREERERFRGKIVKRWEDLAKSLEKVLVERVGIPTRLVQAFTADAEINRISIGTEETKRVVVSWRNWPGKIRRDVSQDEIPVFMAEFDVEDGELKWINFHDRNFVQALRLAQKAELGEINKR